MLTRARGQALVETALVFPIVLVLSLGVLQVALYAHAYDVLVGAVQEGARLASEDGRTLEEGSQRARELVRLGLGSSVEPLRLEGRLTNDTVELEGTAQLRPILPMPGVILPVHGRASVARDMFRPGGGAL